MIMLCPPAHAYLDPGTGSYLLQILAGGFLGIGYIGRRFFADLASKLGCCKKKPTQNQEGKQEAAADPNSESISP